MPGCYDWLGQIAGKSDTLARTITFNYDGNANLISITQTWNVNGSATTHTWATFGWSTQTVQTSFPGLMAVGAPNLSQVSLLSQVGLHDGSRYNFEYAPAGQVNRIRRHSSDNALRSYTAYDYQTGVDDCPRLSAAHVSADNWSGLNGVPSEVVTQYSNPGDGSHQLTAPDGTIYKEFYGAVGNVDLPRKAKPGRLAFGKSGPPPTGLRTTPQSALKLIHALPKSMFMMLPNREYDTSGSLLSITIL
ncbi:MAG TPA: hypothetical protein VNO50_09425 [Pyrinomonadaceae bacterium]|nr:hypothetical protein [Pyrinomonadaceae bacterium]